MECLICRRKIQAAHKMHVWVQNSNGSLVDLGNETSAEAYICASVYNRRNVCMEALNQGRVHLNDDEVAARCPKTAKITEVVY